MWAGARSIGECSKTERFAVSLAGQPDSSGLARPSSVRDNGGLESRGAVPLRAPLVCEWYAFPAANEFWRAAITREVVTGIAAADVPKMRDSRSRRKGGALAANEGVEIINARRGP